MGVRSKDLSQDLPLFEAIAGSWATNPAAGTEWEPGAAGRGLAYYACHSMATQNFFNDWNCLNVTRVILLNFTQILN